VPLLVSFSFIGGLRRSGRAIGDHAPDDAVEIGHWGASSPDCGRRFPRKARIGLITLAAMAADVSSAVR
jgi:hypothetical protein